MATVISRGSVTCDATPIFSDDIPGFIHITCPGCPLDYIVAKTT